MSTWICMSALDRTTTFEMGWLSRITPLGDPRATRRLSLPGNPIRRFEQEPTSYHLESSIRVSSPGARSQRKWNSTKRPPPPISGGPLVPGQPADFRLGPVDNPTLFNRDFSFRLEVPENPYRVTLTVTMDSFINVDLYVRFGEDNDLRNKRVVSDYASERLFGNEEIVITLRSDPPLRAGTYFISLGVRTTGVVAEGTVTAIVERNVPISGGPLTPGQARRLPSRTG